MTEIWGKIAKCKKYDKPKSTPYPLSHRNLWELRSFKQELACLLKSNSMFFHCDVGFLSLGAQAHMLAFLDFAGWDFLEGPWMSCLFVYLI